MDLGKGEGNEGGRGVSASTHQEAWFGGVEDVGVDECVVATGLDGMGLHPADAPALRRAVHHHGWLHVLDQPQGLRGVREVGLGRTDRNGISAARLHGRSDVGAEEAQKSLDRGLMPVPSRRSVDEPYI